VSREKKKRGQERETESPSETSHPVVTAVRSWEKKPPPLFEKRELTDFFIFSN
jgi:hypothetical protein